MKRILTAKNLAAGALCFLIAVAPYGNYVTEQTRQNALLILIALIAAGKSWLGEGDE